MDIFDPATGTWTKGASSPVEMHHFQADRDRKRELLARHAVREYWLVDPEVPRIELFSLRDRALVVPASTVEGTDVVKPPLLPQLILRVADLVPNG